MLTSVALLLLAHRGYPGTLFLIRALGVVLLSQIIVGTLNEYVDKDRDAVAQPGKPIPSGIVAPGVALTLAIVSSLCLIPLAASFGLWPLLVAIVFTGAGVSYDLWLKATLFSAVPYVVAFLCLTSWIWMVAGRLTPSLISIYPVGVAALVAAHLANALPDISADAAVGEHGLAVALGPRVTATTILMLYGFCLVAALLAAGVARSGPGLVLAAATVPLPAIGWRILRSGDDAPRAQSRFFLFMAPAIGLISISCLVSISSVG